MPFGIPTVCCIFRFEVVPHLLGRLSIFQLLLYRFCTHFANLFKGKWVIENLFFNLGFSFLDFLIRQKCRSILLALLVPSVKLEFYWHTDCITHQACVSKSKFYLSSLFLIIFCTLALRKYKYFHFLLDHALYTTSSPTSAVIDKLKQYTAVTHRHCKSQNLPLELTNSKTYTAVTYRHCNPQTQNIDTAVTHKQCNPICSATSYLIYR